MRHASWLAFAFLVGCTGGSPLHAECASERECPAGFVCRGGTCEVPCMNDDDCEGLGGNASGQCTPTGACTIRCFIRTDCPAPLVCPRGGGECER